MYYSERFTKDGFNIGVRNVAPDSWKVKKREFISGGECTYTGTYEEQITLGKGRRCCLVDRIY